MPSKEIPGLILLWLPVLCCMALIFYAGSLPAGDVPPLFPYQDIVFHLGIYLILGLCFCRALKTALPETVPAKAVSITVLFIIFYGITDELHQSFVPGRSLSGLDVFIDSLGGLLGSLIYLAHKSWRKSNPFGQ
ncbi:MAG: hypothetical protein A3G38_01115 [Omnitrophica WOR_2 bacterium RIFCSPLOWO2_12_FULL_51_8]|nr:MAG: hypothetical protein A3G38_01115 [Omnitrophica WOR_2 bacterium RIFCSPLOWO2_12_FULL_51_8]